MTEFFRIHVVQETLQSKESLIVDQAAETDDIFFEYKDDVMKMKETLKYYYQVQGQLFVAGLEQCDLFVWTPNNNAYAHVTKTRYLWSEMLPMLIDCYFYRILPALVAEKLCEATNEIIVFDINVRPSYTKNCYILQHFPIYEIST